MLGTLRGQPVVCHKWLPPTLVNSGLAPVGVSRWLTRTVRIAKAGAIQARLCPSVGSGQPPADPYKDPDVRLAKKGEHPEGGRHLRCRIRSERTLERLTPSGALKGRQGIAQGEALATGLVTNQSHVRATQKDNMETSPTFSHLWNVEGNRGTALTFTSLGPISYPLLGETRGLSPYFQTLY